MSPELTIGNSPLLLAQPHGGTEIPQGILARLNQQGQAIADTDWHITQLYDGLVDDVTVVSTPIHRYVIDANRDPADESLYPGQNTTGLCPTTTFDGIDIYRSGEAPDADEIKQRQQLYHRPYHDALRAQLERIKEVHGYAILYDCHSIRSVVPYLFEGKLPDFNIGTNSGASCDLVIENRIAEICASAEGYSSISNGRFRGGWTTRHFGDPANGFHAIQMELGQCNYMQEEPPWQYQQENAERLRVVLRQILQALLALPSLTD